MPKGIPTTIDYTKIYTNRSGEQYKIVEELPPKCYKKGNKVRMFKVKFIKTGYEYITSMQSVLQGKIVDNTEFNKIYGDKYLSLRNTLNSIDRRILRLLYNIINRCYNPRNSDYCRYGALGVKVCDEWRNNPLQFIHDFKLLPGYEDWLKASDSQKYNYHIDKDMLQQDIPMGRRVYSPKTCTILHNQLNDRIKQRKNKTSKYIGVTKNGITDTWTVSFIHDNIDYRLGIYSSERAAASVFNYVVRHLPNTILNNIDGGEMSIEEALIYLTSKTPISIPEGVKLPIDIDYLYDGSKYIGVKKTVFTGQFQAWIKNDQGIDELLDTYESELAAVNAVNRYYKNHNKSIPNMLLKQNILTDEEIDVKRVLTKREIKEIRRLKLLEMRLNERYVIGHTYTMDNGRQFTILNRPDIKDIKSRYFPVTIRYKDTGEIKTLSCGTLEYLYTISSDRKRHIKELTNIRRQNQSLYPNPKNTQHLRSLAVKKDPNVPSVYGVGYLGQRKFPKELKYIMYKLLWTRMFNLVSHFGKGIDNLSKIDERWRNFSWFVEDIEDLPGYDEWKQTNFAKGYVIENRSKQINIPIEQRIWSKNTCTIMHKSKAGLYRSKDIHASKNQTQKDIYRGVHEGHGIKSNYYTAKITKFGTGKVINIGTFDNPQMAAAAVDYYSQFYNGVSFNGFGYSIPPLEWQSHKMKMTPLYHLIRRPLYYLTGEDEEIRRERCKRIYGLDI